MWSLFVVVPAVVGAFSALVGLVNGGTIVVVTLAADQWQRRRGHKPGEGMFTDREGGHLFGLKVAKDSTDLGQFLAGMVEAFPDMFGEFADKSYDLTVSEGEFLRSMAQSAQGQLADYLTALEEQREEPSNDILLALLELREARLRDALKPIVLYLKSVPDARVKEAL